MSRLNKLFGKPQKFTIGGEEFELKPLTLNELGLFSVDQDAPMREQMDSSKQIIRAVLKKSIPEATDDELDQVSLEHMTEFMEAITKLHKFPEGSSALEMAKKRKEMLKVGDAPADKG